MPSLQIRDLPEAVYRRLAEQAEREHRSLSQQAIILLCRALEASTPPKERRRILLAELSSRPLLGGLGDVPAPEDLIREDRER